MIQRKQTLYLLGALILNSLLFFFPLITFLIGNNVFELGFSGVVFKEGVNPVDAPSILPLQLLLTLTVLVTLVTIFLYKKRHLQIRLSVFNAILMLGLPILIFYYKNWGIVSDTSSFGFVTILPVVSTILTFAAVKNILKDEALVRSYNRIR